MNLMTLKYLGFVNIDVLNNVEHLSENNIESFLLLKKNFWIGAFVTQDKGLKTVVMTGIDIREFIEISNMDKHETFLPSINRILIFIEAFIQRCSCRACCDGMLWICRGAPVVKCGFSKVTLQLYWNHLWMWIFCYVAVVHLHS